MDVEQESNKKIRHLVLSGGGGAGWAFYGALRESNKAGFWDIKDIKTTHGVSVGAIFLTFIATVDKIGWEDYDDFCVKRPWETVLELSIDKLLNVYSKVGICDRNTVENIVSPLLRALELPLNVTLKEFHEFTGIESHIYATNLDEYELVDFSWKTHPDWMVVDVLYCSCALPILFRPNIVDGVCYVDGAFLCNYPLEQCLKMAEDPDEIFGMNSVRASTPDNEPKTEYSNLLEYIGDIISKTMVKLSNKFDTKIRHEIEISNMSGDALRSVYNTLKTRESRAAKVQEGADAWTRYQSTL